MLRPAKPAGDEHQAVNYSTRRGAHRGTSARDLPGSVVNYRNLSRRSESMPTTSTEARGTPAQDPAYRPTRQSLKRDVSLTRSPPSRAAVPASQTGGQYAQASEP